MYVHLCKIVEQSFQKIRNQSLIYASRSYSSASKEVTQMNLSTVSVFFIDLLYGISFQKSPICIYPRIERKKKRRKKWKLGNGVCGLWSELVMLVISAYFCKYIPYQCPLPFFPFYFNIPYSLTKLMCNLFCFHCFVLRFAKYPVGG